MRLREPQVWRSRERGDEARERLSRFVHDARRDGLRCVRVIHGKGLGSIGKQPVLKGKVRNWLAHSPWRTTEIHRSPAASSVTAWMPAVPMSGKLTGTNRPPADRHSPWGPPIHITPARSR